MHPLTHRCVRGGRGAYTWKVSVLCVSLGVYGGVCVCTVYVYVCVCVFACLDGSKALFAVALFTALSTA